MSRSYKHFPLFRDNLWGKSMKEGKRFSNRKVRRKLKNHNICVSNGNNYRRLGLDRWDLYEYKHHQTEHDVVLEWESRQKIIANNACDSWYRNSSNSLEDDIRYWKSSYLRK